jgi:multifunctional 2-oxoglutarate metabolism enzyme
VTASVDVFKTMNAGYAQELYEQFRRDPSSVDPEWRALFESGQHGLEPPPAPPAPPPAPAVSSVPGAPAGMKATAMKGAAARLVENMEKSLSVPTATSFRDVAVNELDARRKALNAALAPAKVSFTHLIAYALVQAARKHPVMTHAFAEIGDVPHRLEPDGVNLGLAVDVEKKDGSRALVVPVIKHAEAMDFAAFRTAYESLVERARKGALMPDDYQGATMTLTNPGTLGTVASVPRLMAGQGSIIATGAIQSGAAGKTMTITSTYDHRIIQGAESGMFLRTVDGLLQGEERFYEGVFESLGLAATDRRTDGPTDGTAGAGAQQDSAPSTRSAGPSVRPSVDDMRHVAEAMALVRAHRIHGHQAARLDPLGSEPRGDSSLNPVQLGLTPDDMARVPAEVLRVYVPGRTLADVYPAMREVYCGTIAYEKEHIASHEQRVWLRQVIERGEHRPALSAEEQQRLLARLTEVEALEKFLHKAYLGQKRFSVEGLDMLVPMLDLLIELAAVQGAHDVMIGMAHRGRLNVLSHVVGVAYETLLAEFEGGRHVEETLAPTGGTGDVKYHHGATGAYATRSGHTVTVALSPNPSHLEAINPVIEGRARALQTARHGHATRLDPARVVPVLIHGDAAFAGQGVVAETLNLAQLKGYTTGGTVHIITNNQVGFTTEPSDARSTDYSSDLAKGFDIPIVHVNADDPEACLAAIRLAMMYREKYHADVVIDLVGYRRWGHNEGDEPSYTQPAMYERIRRHPPVRQRYAEQLAARGTVGQDAAQQLLDQALARLAEVQQQVKATLGAGSSGEEPRRVSAAIAAEPETAVPAELLLQLNEQLLAVPAGFTVNPKLKKQLDRRRETVGDAGGIEWAHAEALAFASLLVEGRPIRLTGQDTERGTFSQRHLVLHDAGTGARHTPIQHLTGARAPMELHNSPLSEYACLGFEYGYAVCVPDALVVWEAQFGDFANGAEIILDQFVIAGLAKWGLTSRLTMLLPHGYEGQGPEHSSARVERYLALGAEGNIRVANCTTPAQYFHLLRRQARHAELRPLIVFTPKSLLRLPQATSRLADLTGGRFEAVIADGDAEARRNDITRLLLCSGKVYYDLVGSPQRAAARHVAVGRVELLYPFPADAVAELARRYPALKEIVWVQEEPRNMGARKFVLPQIGKAVGAGITLRDVSRPERSSPAEGYPAAHAAEQARIVRDAFGA